MTPERREMLQAWVDEWKIRGAFLEQVRRQEIQATDTQRALKTFRGMVTWANETHGLRPTSGLAEYYRKLSGGRTIPVSEKRTDAA